MTRISNTKKPETIDSDLLILCGGVLKNYEKNEYIFKEGNRPQFYHQVIEGKVQMVNETDEGKGFIQGFFSDNESFGEPPIFTGDVYPASALAVQPSVIIRLHITSFINLLKENFDVHLKITRLLADRIKHKSVALREISCHTPEHRILTLLNNLKTEKRNGFCAVGKVKIEYTRQQIADMTGMRVETVIRIMRNLFARKILTIEKGKVYY